MTGRVNMMNLIPKENNPCYGCADRKAMCSIGCKRYKQFKNDLQAQRQRDKEVNQGKYDIIRYNREKSIRLKAYKEKRRR